MATHLETCRLPPTATVKISPDHHRPHRRRGRVSDAFEFNESKKNEGGGGDEAGVNNSNCRTPISPQHMIPITGSCPPAPKKRRTIENPMCRRKLFDLNFFETGAREEVESLFRPTTAAAQVNSSIKRKFTA